MSVYLVTGGCGFIGSNFVHYLVNKQLGDKFIVVDDLTYAGNPSFLPDSSKVQFIKQNIVNPDEILKVFYNYPIDGVFNFAAETHVDRSALVPLQFVHTNVVGTTVLLECAMLAWAAQGAKSRFLQISTDEVYGSLGYGDPLFRETSPLCPSSPYSASKAAADHVVMSYHHVFGLDTVITRCSNNYGPRQHSEKFIPRSLERLSQGRPIQLHGSGNHVRDWIHVADHCEGIWKAFHDGLSGSVYNLGGQTELSSIELANSILKIAGHDQQMIEYITDRPGNDLRYALDISRARYHLHWLPQIKFEDGLRDTIDWYAGR